MLARLATDRRGLIFVAVCAALTMDALNYGVVTPFLPQRATDLGASPFAVTAIYAAYAAGLILFTLPSGILSDRLGRKPVIMAGGFGLAASTLVFAYADSVWLLAVSRFLQGIAGALWWTPSLAVIADLYPAAQRGAKMGLAMSITAGGDLLGPVFGGALTELGSYRVPLFVIVAISAVTATAFGAIYRSGARRPREQRAPLASTLLHPVVVMLCATAALAAFGIGMLQPLLPLDLEERFGAGPLAIGIVFSAPVLGFLMAGLFVGRLSDRIGRVRPIVLGTALVAAVTPFAIVVPALWLVAAVLFLVGFGEGSMEAPSLPLLAESTGGEGEGEDAGHYGAVYALFDTAFGLGALFGPLTGGAVAELLDLRTALFAYSAVLAVFVPFLWLRIRPFDRRPGTHAPVRVPARHASGP